MNGCIWSNHWRMLDCMRGEYAACPIHGDAAREAPYALQEKLRAADERTTEDAYEVFWAIVSDVWTSDEYLDLVSIAGLMDEGEGEELQGEDEIPW